jgi:hypothetical protein
MECNQDFKPEERKGKPGSVAEIDHLIYVCEDLKAGMQRIHTLLGVKPKVITHTLQAACHANNSFDVKCRVFGELTRCLKK